MADLKVTQLSDLGAVPAVDDLLMVVDISDTSMSAGGTNKKVTANYLGRTSGAVLYAQDGKALTLPAAGTVALLAQAQTFTDTQTIDKATEADVLLLKMNGTLAASIKQKAIIFASRDFGANGDGPFIAIGRNTNAQPGAGYFSIEDKGGTLYAFWPDDSGVFRIATVGPGGNDTAGTVVGSQTSMLEAKSIVGELSGIELVLLRIAQGAASVRRFAYKSGAYSGQEFEGCVTDFAPAYGMDRDDSHPQGKSLNEITILGDLLRAVANLTERVLALEARLK